MSSKKYLWLSYSEHRTGGERLSDEEFSDHADEHITVNFTNLSRVHPKKYWNVINIEVSDEVYDAENVYVVVVRYSDGDTFSHTYGYWDIQLITTDTDEALVLSEKLEAEAKSSKDDNGSKPWNGYFASFDQVEIHTFKIEDY